MKKIEKLVLVVAIALLWILLVLGFFLETIARD